MSNVRAKSKYLDESNNEPFRNTITKLGRVVFVCVRLTYAITGPEYTRLTRKKG